MGCRLVRGETIYFVRHGGPAAGETGADWFHDGFDQRLLPPVFTRSGGREYDSAQPAAVPVEIHTFQGS